MRTGILRCKHCKSKYYYLYSGYSNGEYSKSLDYCISCYEAVTNALEKIPVKFGFEYVETNEVSYETLEKWKKEYIDEHTGLLPLCRRVFPSASRNDFSAQTITDEVKGKEGEFKNRSYLYWYWSDKPNEVIIKVKKEIEYMDDGTKKEIGYWSYDKDFI